MKSAGHHFVDINLRGHVHKEVIVAIFQWLSCHCKHSFVCFSTVCRLLLLSGLAVVRAFSVIVPMPESGKSMGFARAATQTALHVFHSSLTLLLALGFLKASATFVCCPSLCCLSHKYLCLLFKFGDVLIIWHLLILCILGVWLLHRIALHHIHLVGRILLSGRPEGPGVAVAQVPCLFTAHIRHYCH